MCRIKYKARLDERQVYDYTYIAEHEGEQVNSQKYDAYKKWYQDVKGWSLLDLMHKLCEEMKGTRPSDFRFGPCPACGSLRDKTDRPPVRVYYIHRNAEGGGKATMDRWICNSCQVTGNIFDFIAYREAGTDAASVRPKGYGIQQLFIDACLSDAPVEKAVNIVKKIQYPPTNEVMALLTKSTILNKCNEKRITNFLNKRGLIHEKMTSAGVAPKDFDYESLSQAEGKTCGWFIRSWAKKFPILIPLVDYKGNLRSLMARALNSSNRKTTCPIGYDVGKLFFANVNARLFLKKQIVPKKVWICEGEMDYLTMSMAENIYVIGVRSGSMSHLQLMPWKKEQTVYIATHNDKAGEQYAAEIKRNIYPARWKRVDMRNFGAGI